MNKLIIPLVGAVVAGLCGGSAFSYVNAKDAAKVVALHVADSLAKVAKEEHARQLAQAAEELPLTPADSIRLEQNQPTTLSSATHDLPNAVDPKHAAPADEHGKSAPATKAVATNTAPKSAAPSATSAPKGAATSKPVAGAPAKTIVPTDPAHAVEAKVPAAIESAMPERRISKMFSSMASKDAAKILEQMSDNDVRVILGMMGDKQAAAILTSLPAARAAAISKSELNKTPKDDKKPAGVHP